jgi:hypothetical protein
MNATYQLDMHSGLGEVCVICDKAYRFAGLLAVSTAGYAVYELEVKQVKDVSPVNIVVAHEAVERIFLDVEYAAKCRGRETVGILHHEEWKQQKQVQELDGGEFAVLRFLYSYLVFLQSEGVHDVGNAIYCQVSIIFQEKFL